MSTTPPSKTPTPKSESKVAKTAVADGEKKARAPKQDYGFTPEAIIGINNKAEDSPKFRGQRLDWFEKLCKSEGKTAKEFLDKNAGKDSPRGWLRFFVADVKVATLTAPKKTA